jgi:hypothetical protein
MSEHEWKFVGNYPVRGEYWFRCANCGLVDHISRERFIKGLKPDPPNKPCLEKTEEVKKGNPWKDAVLNAMKSYNMDIAHYENEPDNAVCDLLYMHANAEAHRAMMDYFSKEGDSKG